MLAVWSILFAIVSAPTVTAYFCSNLQECQRLADLRVARQVDRQSQFVRLRANYTTTDESKRITNMTLEELLGQLQTRQLTAVDALAAFMTRALDATEDYNCVAMFIPNARKMAEELDRSPSIKGPLHGLPVCVSENIDIQGMESTLGYSKRLKKVAKKSASITKTLTDLGAVPFCKSNVPQTLFTMGSDNPIFGRTRNPLNTELTTGGSLSGAACLVAAGALKIAPGIDLGGCARFAAHNTGIAGFKATEGRMSLKGVVPPIPGLVGLEPSAGFVADKPKTIGTIMKLMTENGKQALYDSTVAPLPWNSSLYETARPLRIGYISSLGLFPSMGDTPNTLKDAATALEKRGHKVIPMQDVDSFEAFDIYADLITADGGAYFKRMLDNDAVAASFEAVQILLSMPPWKRRFLSFLPFSERVRLILSAGVDVSRSDKLWDRVAEKDEFREYILKMMENDSLDIIISPVLPFPAPRNDITAHLLQSTVYTTIWNLVQFPAGTVRFGKESGQNVGDYDDQRDFSLNLVKTNFESSVGMPIGVQVIGKPFQDELVLRIMNELEDSHAEATRTPDNGARLKTAKQIDLPQDHRDAILQ